MSRELLYANMEDGVAVMRLDKWIGPVINSDGEELPSVPFINGPDFANEMTYLKKQGKKVQVRINSPGGNVGHGWDIMDAVSQCDASTHCYGLAASMAGMILLAGKKRTMDEHATLMFHGPRQSNGDKQSQYAKMVREGFKVLFESTTSLTVDKITAILEKGDHYFDSGEALKSGIVDKVVPSKMKVEKPTVASIEEFEKIYASLETKTMDTPNWLKPLFGGNNDTENMTAAMKLKADYENEKSEKAKLIAEKTLLEGRIAALEAAQKESAIASVKEKATSLIKKAIADKKLVLDAAKESEMILAAEKDYSTIELMLNAMQAQKTNSVMASIKDDKGVNMSYKELAEKHPDTLKAIAENQPELFNSLMDEHIKSTKK